MPTPSVEQSGRSPTNAARGAFRVAAFVREGAPGRARGRRLRVAFAVVACLGLVGCSGVAPATGGPGPLDAARSTAEPSPTIEPLSAPTAEPLLPAGTLVALGTAVPTDAPAPAKGPTPPPTSKPAGPRFYVPILLYHVIAPWSVASPYSAPNLDVSALTFDAQLRGLHDQGWRTIAVDELAGYMVTGRQPPARTFVISIDDGHADGYTYALPILVKYTFVATFYVIAGRVGNATYLTWDQVRALMEDGMEIGNHTVDHVPLTGLTPAGVTTEIAGAQALFLANLGVAPTTFAYPFGSVNTVASRAVSIRRRP